MFAGRSTKSLKSFKKTHASSSSSVLYALWACVFLIVVLGVDVTWSMSLDKLALERNVILESQPDSSISDNDGSAVDDMQLEAVPEQGNTDLFVLLPTNNHDDVGDIDRNTIDVGAQEHGSDMLMMETNDEPAMEIVAAVEPALAAAVNDVEKIKKVTNDEEQLVPQQQDQQQLVEVETPAQLIAATQEDTPIMLLLAEPSLEQEQAETLKENSKTEALEEQIKMVEIPELIENQQQEVSINLDAVEEPVGINIPVDVVEDLGNALEAEATENAGNKPVVGTTKLELESVDEINNHLETANVEEIAQTIDEILNTPVVQQQKVVPEDTLKENMENVVVAGSVPSAEEATVQEVIDAIEDALESQQAAQQSDSENELVNRPEVETAADASVNVIKAEDDKTPMVQVHSEGEEDQNETLPVPEKLEGILEAVETYLTEQEQNGEKEMQVEQAMDEEPKNEALKQEEPKEEQPKGDESMKEETLDEVPAKEEQEPEIAQQEKVELVENIEEAKVEEPAKSDPIEIEMIGELPKVEELKEEQVKTEEVQFSDNNKADQVVLEEAQISEEQTNGENNESIVEESTMEQNNEEKIAEEEMQVNEQPQEEQTHEQFVEENLQEQNLQVPINDQVEKQNEDEQAQVEPVMEALVLEEQKEEQHMVEAPEKEQQIVEEQTVEEINNEETVPTIEIVAPTNNDLEPLNIVEEAQNIEVQDEEVLPEPVEAIETQQNEDKTSLEIPEEIKEAAIEEQLMPVVDVSAADSVDQKEDETMTDNKEEEQLPEKVQKESELQTEEKPAAMQHETEVPSDTAVVDEEMQEVAAQTNPNETTPMDEDKTQIAYEEENEKEVENPETNSMLTTIVQVPVQQLLPPVQDELQLSLLPPVREEVKIEEKDVEPIQMPAESVTIAKPIVQTPQAAEQAPAVVAQEQQQPPTQVIIEPATQKPLNVMDSVLNYVNASFAANVINSNYPIQQQQLQQQDNDDTYSSQLRRYDGAQVWRIVVQNDKDKKLADELQTKFDGQLWKEVKQEVDYLLKPQVLAAAAWHIRAANLSRIVLIDNLQKVIEVENPPADEIALLQNRKGHRLTWQAYHRLEDIHGFFDYLAKTYPDICSVETIGYSLEKRPLKILKISNGNANNSGIWMDGGMHAREWISPASVTYVANQLVEGWDDLPENMRNINWYIHAVANPDGYEYTHTTDRLWRKNMRSHGRQCPGVDLNRNFGYKWGGKGTSANPCSQTYRGSKAFSEPETFYISKFISNYPRETFQAYLSFHSYGQYILYPWGYDYQVTKDRADLDRVARQAGTIITKSSGVKYTVGSSASTLYPAAGGSDDWAKGIAGIKFSYTIEMGDTGRYGFVLPANMIESNAQDAYTFVQTVASAVTNPAKWSRKRAI